MSVFKVLRFLLLIPIKASLNFKAYDDARKHILTGKTFEHLNKIKNA